MDERLAVIDIGSNTARLAVFDAGGREVGRDREALKLVRAVAGSGSLGPAARARLVRTIARFAATARAAGATKVVAVGTSALRDARDGSAACRQIRAATGIGVSIMDGTIEASLACRGVLGATPMTDAVVVDLGGGSADITEVRGGRIAGRWSLQLGALRVSDQWLRSDPPAATELAGLTAAVRKEIAAALPSRLLGLPLVCAGGTARNIAETMGWRKSARASWPVSVPELARFVTRTAGMTLAERAAMRGLNPDRSDSIVGGAVVIAEIARHLGVRQIAVCRGGLREGIAAAVASGEMAAAPMRSRGFNFGVA